MWFISHRCILIHLEVEEVLELFKRELSITICVDPSDDCENFSLNKVITELSEEVLEVGDLNVTFLIAINGAESSIGCVVWVVLQIFNKHSNSLDEINLVVQEAGQSTLLIVWK